MNALPLKSPEPLNAVVDELVASFGLRRVVMAVAARLFRKQHPPDRRPFAVAGRRPAADYLSDHLRKDMGLPPDNYGKVQIDPIMLRRQ